MDKSVTTKGNGLKYYSVTPRTISSYCHSNNKPAFDWGWHGLLAWASQCSIVIADTRSIQQVQCLTKHKAHIRKVLWSPQGYELRNHSNMCLASADINGYIGFTDVYSGKTISFVQDSNKSVLTIEWVPSPDKSTLYLASLHSLYSFVIWNVNDGTKLWKKTFTDTLNSFCFDPFDFTKLAFLCPDCILFVDEFSVSKAPSTNGRKFYISSPRLAEENLRTRDRLKKLMRGLVVGENIPRPEDAMTISECLQLTYHKSLRNHILLLYPRDILLIDLHINMTVGVISIDKATSPLLQIISCDQRDVLYCLHESGSISVRVRRQSNSNFLMSSPFDTPMDTPSKYDPGSTLSEKFLWYDQRCQSDSIRQIKGIKMLSIAVCPITQKHIALLLTNGKIIFLELEKVDSLIKTDRENQMAQLTLSYLLPSSTYESAPINRLKLITSAVINDNPWPITVIKMCSIIPTTNAAFDHSHLLAIGTTAGHVLMYNIHTCTIYKEFCVHNNAVRGIEWCGSLNLISWAQVECGGNRVKNELFITNLITGQSRLFRSSATSESAIEFVRVSPMRQYFVLVKKDGKLELWNVKKLSIVRSMPDKFPSVKALEWAPMYNTKLHSRRKSEDSKESDSGGNRRKLSSASGEDATREHLVFCDFDSILYHFSVENNTFHDGIKIPPENLVASVTSLAFKGNKIVQADIEGHLNIWDLKAQISRSISTGRTCISKIKFSPGKGSLKLLVLYIDGGVDLYDLKQSNSDRMAQLKCPKDVNKVLDIDWVAPQTPILVTDDGCMLITDINFSEWSSPLYQYSFEEELICLALIPNSSISVIHAWCCIEDSKEGQAMLFRSNSFTEAVLDHVKPLLSDKMNTSNLKIVDRCLIMSILFKQLDDIRFWTVLSYYLQAASFDVKCSKDSSDDALVASGVLSNTNKFLNKYPTLQPLDTSYDILCDAYSYQKMQLEQVELHEWKRGDYQHTQRVIQRLILLGEMDRAVQLLLETEFSNSNYYADAIKACLVAAVQNTGSAQSTIKLVATNFIANGKIWEGIQLLCLIGKRADACRYLISYGLWESAVWLAKSALYSDDVVDVMKKWACHLKNIGDLNNATLVLISQLQFEAALELLVQNNFYAKAMLILLACEQYNIAINNVLANTVKENFEVLLAGYNLKMK